MTQTRTNPWKALERVAQSPQGSAMIPMVGSGFVTQAVLEGCARRSGAARPRTVDWYALLEHVAEEFQLTRATSQIRHDVPGQTTLLWDAMVAELAQRSPRTTSAYRWEARLRRAIAKRLREDEATSTVARGFVESFLKLGWEDIFSFNFDRVLLVGGARPVHAARGALKRASLVARVGPKTRVWFPHGHQSDPESIVLGAHAYGVRIAAMQAAFDAHARTRTPRASRELDTWVATALERPLLFLGLSLTREEWTIWWLLTQRARFLARRPAARRPQGFVFVRRPRPHERLEAHAAFQTLARACELLDLVLLEYSDHTAGWKRLRSALAWYA